MESIAICYKQSSMKRCGEFIKQILQHKRRPCFIFHSALVVKRLNDMFQNEQKQVEELKYMLYTERRRNNEL